MCDSVIDLFTREINRDIINPFIAEREAEINELLEDVKKDISIAMRVPLVKLTRLPEPKED